MIHAFTNTENITNFQGQTTYFQKGFLQVYVIKTNYTMGANAVGPLFLLSGGRFSWWPVSTGGHSSDLSGSFLEPAGGEIN